MFNLPTANRPVMPRRWLLKAGGLGCLGLVPSLLKPLVHAADSQPAASTQSTIKSCVVLFYYGGPSHVDTWDMKPGAPREVRGEYQSIETAVPGVRICEHLPRCARVMDRLSVVRSMHHTMRNHNSAAVEALCGRMPLRGDLELLSDDSNSAPCYGAALSALRPSAGDVPTHIALPHVMYNVVVLPGQTAGFLGAGHQPFQVASDPSSPNFRVGELELPAELSLSRLDDRQSLLSIVDSQLRQSERSLALGAQSAYHDRAFDLLHSEKVRRAFHIGDEPDAVRDRYGRNTLGQSLLLARRLVEAGVPFLNVNDKVANAQTVNWDSHETIFPRAKNDLLPPADQGFSAFIEDLDQRGLLESTLVVALGEFGRTPKINGNAGRDHWPDCFSVVLAGGGIAGGQMYGASDSIGAYPTTNPVTPGDLAATIFWKFGLNPETEIRDRTGRPFRLAEGSPLAALFG